MAKEITDATWQDMLLANDLLVVDFWAAWCGPCKMMMPIFEEMEKEFGDKITFGKVNVDENEKICTDLGIMNIPTLLFFKEGKQVDKYVGACPKNTLQEKLNKLL